MAFEREPTWSVLAMNIQALRLAGRLSDALVAAGEWVANNPGHVPSGLTKGVLLQSHGEFQKALAAYRAVISIAPDNLVALNNAAWIAHELGVSDALSLAERAYRAAPENASVLDTLGWILLSEGQTRRAIDILSKAAELAPRSAEIRYHLSKALIAGGDPSRAREVLAGLLSEARDFDGRSDAESLLESMQAEVAIEQ